MMKNIKPRNPKDKNLRGNSNISLIEKTETFFQKYQTKFFYTTIAIAFILSLLLFDKRVSLGGDDSFYIIRALNFIHDFKFPDFQGPLYPILLSPFVYFFGINLIVLKTISFISIIFSLFILFKTFENKIPSTVLILSLLFVSLNSYFIYFSSQTYSEAFYLLIQSICLYYFLKFVIDIESLTKESVIKFIWFALLLLALVLTRNVGFIAIPAIAFVLMIKRNWKSLLLFILTFSIIFFLFQLLKNWIWPSNALPISQQANALLYKNYYDPSQGVENFFGFIQRFIDNSNGYISVLFISILGYTTIGEDSVAYPLITIIFYVLLIFGLINSYKRNWIIFISLVLSSAFLVFTFFILQSDWQQTRLLFPVFPFLSIFLFYILFILFYNTRLKSISIVFFLIVIISFGFSLRDTFQKIKENSIIEDEYSGLTPDWKNYLKASVWAAENTSNDAVIGCRKASISSIYSKGRIFKGIESIKSYKSSYIIQNWTNSPDDRYFAVNYNKNLNKGFDSILENYIHPNLEAILFKDNESILVFSKNEKILNKVFETFSTSGIVYYTKPEQLISSLYDNISGYSCYFPDSLLKDLYNRKFNYIITASLRSNPENKENGTINSRPLKSPFP